MITGVDKEFTDAGELLSFIEAKTAELERKIGACKSPAGGI
jgi:hypothetical protein